MSYTSVVLKDSPVGFWPLDESTGNTAFDHSGCGNDGTYFGFMSRPQIFPLVSGGKTGTAMSGSCTLTFPIVFDYTGETAKGTFGDKYSSDNDFTLEAWVYIKDTNIYTSNAHAPVSLLGSAPHIGIYFVDDSIRFYVDYTTYVAYQPDSLNKLLHIVGIYNPGNISLYINGELVASKSIPDFKFTNNELSAIISNGGGAMTDLFIIDAPAVYRYALSEQQIKSHYNSSNPIPAIQIISPDGGVLFSGSDYEALKTFTYSYPINKKWTQFVSADIEYNGEGNYLTLTNGVSSATFYDYFIIPAGIDFISSKIEWNSDNRITISSSIDGETYIPCTNGHPLPQWMLGDNTFSTEKIIYLKVDFYSETPNETSPRLKNINISFYNEKVIHADNYGDYISLEQPSGTGIDASIWDMSAPSIIYPVLTRNELAGFKPEGQAGFVINTDTNLRSLEFIVRTPDAMSNGCLFSHESAWLEWDSSYLINKQGIDAIYVNGQEVTTETDISQYLIPGEIHHVVIDFAYDITTKIYMNARVDTGEWTNSEIGYSYSNIAIYPAQLGNKALGHYNLYTEAAYSYADTVSMTMTETGIKAYNNDWQVVKSV